MVRNDLSCFDQPNRRNDPLHQLLRALLQIEQLQPGPTPRRNKGTDSNKVCGTEEYRQGLAALHKKLNALPNSAKSDAKFLLEVADSKDNFESKSLAVYLETLFATDSENMSVENANHVHP